METYVNRKTMEHYPNQDSFYIRPAYLYSRNHSRRGREVPVTDINPLGIAFGFVLAYNLRRDC